EAAQGVLSLFGPHLACDRGRFDTSRPEGPSELLDVGQVYGEDERGPVGRKLPVGIDNEPVASGRVDDGREAAVTEVALAAPEAVQADVAKDRPLPQRNKN